MTDTFYVLYSPEVNMYLDQDFHSTYYKYAARYGSSYGNYADSALHNARLFVPDAKWVGPCKEGEEP